jgi:hypothetical protein
MSPNEARTRKEKIDPALLKAGWNLHDPLQVGIEIPVDGYDAEPWNGITDYCLYRENGEVVAVVEAKKQLRDPNVAREQARHYITEIAKNQSFQPFAFLANGLETYFWDQQNAAPRLVAGFFTLPDLERLLYENAIAPADDPTALARLETDRGKLAALEAEIHPLQREFNQLSRQFWVTKDQVAANRYDLSASRYRPLEQEEAYYDQPKVTLSRLAKLEEVMMSEIAGLRGLLN